MDLCPQAEMSEIQELLDLLAARSDEVEASLKSEQVIRTKLTEQMAHAERKTLELVRQSVMAVELDGLHTSAAWCMPWRSCRQ